MLVCPQTTFQKTQTKSQDVLRKTQEVSFTSTANSRAKLDAPLGKYCCALIYVCWEKVAVKWCVSRAGTIEQTLSFEVRLKLHPTVCPRHVNISGKENIGWATFKHSPTSRFMSTFLSCPSFLWFFLCINSILVQCVSFVPWVPSVFRCYSFYPCTCVRPSICLSACLSVSVRVFVFFLRLFSATGWAKQTTPRLRRFWTLYDTSELLKSLVQYDAEKELPFTRNSVVAFWLQLLPQQSATIPVQFTELETRCKTSKKSGNGAFALNELQGCLDVHPRPIHWGSSGSAVAKNIKQLIWPREPWDTCHVNLLLLLQLLLGWRLDQPVSYVSMLMTCLNREGQTPSFASSFWGYLVQDNSICMHACMYVCMYVCMYIYIYIIQYCIHNVFTTSRDYDRVRDWSSVTEIHPCLLQTRHLIQLLNIAGANLQICIWI